MPAQRKRRRAKGAAARRAARSVRTAAIEERRWLAWQMRVVRKFRIAGIATALEVSERTVALDLAAMRRVRVDHLRQAEKAKSGALDAGIEVIEECDAACRQAWTDLLAADEGSATRAKFLRVLLDAITQRVKILQSLGMLKRVPDELLVGESIRAVADSEAREILGAVRVALRGKRRVAND